MALFMFGAYVSDISCSVAWGGEGGSCQMTLVEDPPNQIQISLPPVGTPVFIQHGAFYFGGIFQRYTYKGSISGRLYDVIIESPAKLLDGIQVILDDFNGRVINAGNTYSPESADLFTNQILNVYNVYAEVESTQGFGNSFVNSSGFPADSLLRTLQTLMNGGGQFGGKATFGSYQYGLDISQIISVLNGVNYRIKGPVQSLASIISECCEAAGLDYFVELTGGGAGNTIASPVIRLRTINRSTSAGRGQVAQLVLNAGNLVSGDVGEEFALPVTQKLVIGGPVSRWVRHNMSNSTPVWGKLSDGTFAYVNGSFTPGTYSNPDAILPVFLDEYSLSGPYTATMFELRMAMGGKDLWETFKMLETLTGKERNLFRNPDTAPWNSKLELTREIISKINNRNFVALEAEATSLSAAQKALNTSLQEQSDLIFSAVNRVASNFYGQVFFMPLQLDQDIKYIQEDIQYKLSWDIVDSAFHPDILYHDPAFYDGEGRLKGVSEWPIAPNTDYSGFAGEWAVSDDGYLIATTKGGAEKEVYYINGIPYVIVKSGAQVPYYDSLTTADFGLSVLSYKFFGIWLDPAKYLTAGGNNLQLSIPPAVQYPQYIGIAQQSNIYSWGPWWAWRGGSVGKSEIVMDESLKPETFGGYDVLDLAGFAKATTGTSEAVPLETGSVQVIGQPTFNLADRIAGSAYISGIDIKVDASGETVTYKFSNWTAQFGKISSANIDRIAKIYKGNLALAQRNRSNIQKRPLPKIRFEKSELLEIYKNAKNRQETQSPVMITSYMNQVLGGT